MIHESFRSYYRRSYNLQVERTKFKENDRHIQKLIAGQTNRVIVFLNRPFNEKVTFSKHLA